MRANFALRNFRGFLNQPAVPIRRVTLLVGENSAGKTSFMAALKFILDAFHYGETPSFNKDPFQLGTFDQIAHYRGGRAGRKEFFQFTLSRSMQIDNKRETGTVEIRFDRHEGQAYASQFSFRVGDVRANVEFYKNRGTINIGRDRFDFSMDDFPGLRGPEEILPPIEFLLTAVIPRAIAFGENQKDEKRGYEIANMLRAYYRQFSNAFRGKVYAISPIRTKPSRTYTPGQEKEDSEGSHIPFEIAKLSRSQGDEWHKIQSDFTSFGERSDMFTELDVKKFGSSVSDPFQLQFSYGGPKRNIVDLGYGTSQILPLLYDISVSEASASFLIQQPEVHLHPRAQAALGQLFIDVAAQSNRSFVVETHSDYIVDRVRQGVREGSLKKTDVTILFFDRSRLENRVTPVSLDDQGNIVNPPPGYRRFFLLEEMRNLGIAPA